MPRAPWAGEPSGRQPSPANGARLSVLGVGTVRPRRLRRARIAGALVAIAAIVLMASTGRFDARRALATITRIGAASIALAALGCAVQIGLQATRLWSLCRAAHGRSWPVVARAFFLGEIVNAFFPARSGDVLKVVMLRGRGQWPAPFAEVAGVLVADRLAEMLALLAVLALGPGAMWLTQDVGGRRVAIAGATMIFVLAVAVALARRFHIVGQIVVGLRVLLRPRTFAVAFAAACTMWLAEAVALDVLVSAAGYPIGVAASLQVLGLLALAIIVPISLANVGTYEAAIVVGLSALGVPVADGIAIAALHHLLQLAVLAAWSAAVLGPPALVRRGPSGDAGESHPNA